MTDQAQSPRLGQKLPPELPGIQLLTINTLPEVAFKGQIVFLNDLDTFSVFDGTAWQIPSGSGGGGGGGFNQIFVSPDQPVADNVGDQWYETDTSILYVWDGTSWKVAHDPRYDALADQIAINEANTVDSLSHLQDQLDGKVTTFYDTVQPATADSGDLWYNTTTNKLYRFDGTTWNEITDPAAVAAIQAAGNAQSTADGKITTYYGDNPPWANGAVGHAADAGDLWVESDANNKLWRWSGTAWVAVNDPRVDTHDAAIITLNNQMAQRPIHIESTNAPGSTANTAGTIWERYDTLNSTSRKLIGAWRGLGGTSWVPISLDVTYIPVLDIATGTAGQLAVSRLVVSDLTNYARNPQALSGMSNTWTSGVFHYASDTNNPSPLGTSTFFRSNQAKTTGWWTLQQSELIPVRPGEQFSASCWARRFDAGSNVGYAFFGLRWLNASGGLISDSWALVNVSAFDANWWQELSIGPAAAPSGAASLQILGGLSDTANGYLYDFTDFEVRRAIGGELIVDGAIDGKIITGATIRTAASGARVYMDTTGIYAYNAGGAQTFAVTTSGGSGTFSGALNAASGTFAGTLSGANGTFTGSLSGATGTFTGTLSGGTVTGSIVQTSSGNNRMRMRNDGIGGILEGLTGDGAEDLPGAVNPNIVGSAGGRQGSLDLWSPRLTTTSGFDRAHLYLLSRSANSNTAPSIEADAIINANRGLFTTGDITASEGLFALSQTGTVAGDAEFGPGGGLRRKGSTQRIKKNLQDLGIVPSKVAGLRTMTYQFDDEEFYGTGRYPGLIAEDLDAAGLGDFVIYDEAGLPSAIRYSEFAAVGVVKLTQTVISLNQQLNQLQTQVAALAAKVNKTP